MKTTNSKRKATNTRRRGTAVILSVTIIAALLIGGLIVISLNNGHKNSTNNTNVDSQQAEEMRLDAIAQQIRIKAESYHERYGVWPESLDDIHETADRLPNLVFNSFADFGFIMSYTGVNNEKIVYCSDDFAQTSLGKKNCP